MNTFKSHKILAAAICLRQIFSGRSLLIGGIVFYSSVCFSQGFYLNDNNSIVQTKNDTYFNEDGIIGKKYEEEVSDFRQKSANLVYTPISHCRLVDTRAGNDPASISAGKILGRRKFSLNYLPSNYTSHTWRCALGGSSDYIGDVRAVHMNITATEAEGDGVLLVGPIGSTNNPFSSTLNFGPDEVAVANGVIVEMGNQDPWEFEITTSAKTHVVIDLYGYFTQPPPVDTRLSIEKKMKITPVAPNTTDFIYSGYCTPGTQWLSGSIDHGSDQVYTLELTEMVAYGGSPYTACRVQNQSNVVVDVTCKANCIP